MKKIQNIKNEHIEALKKNISNVLLKDDVAVHQLLEKLAKKLNAFIFGVSYGRDDNPALRAGFFVNGLDAKPTNLIFNDFKLASIRNNGRLIVGERDIALWTLSELYDKSPIEFKCEAIMHLEEYAFWMRTSLGNVEKIFCKEVLDDLMRYVKYDNVWKIFSVYDGWIDIDPWKFMIEVDLT